MERPKYPLERPRTNGKPGVERVVETDQRYQEPDRSDVRVKRVYVEDADGEAEHTFLEDELGVRFRDNLGYEDR